jgi:hypothetical protein
VARFVDSNDPRLVGRRAEHRARFATTLAGRWSTVRGTFDAIMSEQWEFRDDGTVCVTYSARSGTHREEYRWERAGPFQIRIGLPPEEGCPEGTWKVVNYGFDVLEHDAGKEVVLHEVGKEGFWLSDAPLRSQK